MNARQVKADMKEIARITGQELSTVRNHARTGRLSLDSFELVCDYVVGHKLLRRIEAQYGHSGNGN